jgi:hypothetical protein
MPSLENRSDRSSAIVPVRELHRRLDWLLYGVPPIPLGAGPFVPLSHLNARSQRMAATTRTIGGAQTASTHPTPAVHSPS